MKRVFFFIVLIVSASCLSVLGQNLSHTAISSGGGTFSISPAAELSFTIGEPIISTHDISTVGILTQGFQQTSRTTRNLNLVLFLEGLYISDMTMRKVTNGLNPIWLGDTAERITVELHNPVNYSDILHSDSNVFLMTNGNASMEFPGTLNGSYYITVKNWHTLETVSKNPVSFAGGANVAYEFYSDTTKAYGNNLKKIGGKYVMFTGDVSNNASIYPNLPVQDGIIDIDDIYYVFASIQNGDLGFRVTDLNGDGMVDFEDIYLAYFNNLAGIIKATPP